MKAEELAKDIIAGGQIDRERALWLYGQPLEELCARADQIRRHFCGDGFDLCTIVNGKSGRCSENCRFCAQSAYHHTGAKEYPLLPMEEILEGARRNAAQGVLRYSIVTSGRRLSDEEVDQMCRSVRMIRDETELSVCVSFGLLGERQYRRLKEAGVSRVHNNLETSRRYFPSICTTHTFEDKIRAIRAAQSAGLSVCSGGIMGLGEEAEDRIDMALTLRELGIKSVPVNLMNPIPGTPLADNRRLTKEELERIVAVFRFILPDASIRLAGGRGILEDKGRGCFRSGANAAISGDMLTTAGITVEQDMEMLKELGYRTRYGK
ncbi:MAG: biotin synthase BioB [Lachnospiraceae bacterium]|nr:biotin synthase BioB [Lachnospiraceae bacterium]